MHRCEPVEDQEQAVPANGGPAPGVRSFVRKWCPVGRYHFGAYSIT